MGAKRAGNEIKCEQREKQMNNSSIFDYETEKKNDFIDIATTADFIYRYYSVCVFLCVQTFCCLYQSIYNHL